MVHYQNGGRPGGGFLRILGIIYLIKIIRRRRRERHRSDHAEGSSAS